MNITGSLILSNGGYTTELIIEALQRVADRRLLSFHGTVLDLSAYSRRVSAHTLELSFGEDPSSSNAGFFFLVRISAQPDSGERNEDELRLGKRYSIIHLSVRKTTLLADETHDESSLAQALLDLVKTRFHRALIAVDDAQCAAERREGMPS